MEQSNQQTVQKLPLPRKTKIAARWLLIAGRVYLVVCLIILAFVFIVIATDESCRGYFSSLCSLPWTSGPPMGYLNGFLYFLLGIEQREIHNLPLVFIIGIPLLLPLLCIFFGKSLLFNRKWIKKKSGYFFIMIILLVYLITAVLSIIGYVALGLRQFGAQVDVLEHILWGLLHCLIYSPVLSITLPPFILLYLDRKNFLKTVP